MTVHVATMNVEVSDGMAKAIEAVNAVMELPKDQRKDYLEMLGHVATKYMRLLEGEEFTRGWLSAALAELDGPPPFVLREPN